MDESPVVARVLGTEDSTPLEFWVGVGEESFLQLDDVVATDRVLPGGDPVRIYPTGEAEAIQAALAEARWSLLPVIFGLDDAGGRCEQLRAALTRYTAAMVCHHRQDRIVQKGSQSWLEQQ